MPVGHVATLRRERSTGTLTSSIYSGGAWISDARYDFTFDNLDVECIVGDEVTFEVGAELHQALRVAKLRPCGGGTIWQTHEHSDSTSGSSKGVDGSSDRSVAGYDTDWAVDSDRLEVHAQEKQGGMSARTRILRTQGRAQRPTFHSGDLQSSENAKLGAEFLPAVSLQQISNSLDLTAHSTVCASTTASDRQSAKNDHIIRATESRPFGSESIELQGTVPARGLPPGRLQTRGCEQTELESVDVHHRARAISLRLLNREIQKWARIEHGEEDSHVTALESRFAAACSRVDGDPIELRAVLRAAVAALSPPRRLAQHGHGDIERADTFAMERLEQNTAQQFRLRRLVLRSLTEWRRRGLEEDTIDLVLGHVSNLIRTFECRAGDIFGEAAGGKSWSRLKAAAAAFDDGESRIARGCGTSVSSADALIKETGILGNGVLRMHACDQPGCDMNCTTSQGLQKHKANKHDIGIKWHFCKQPGCKSKFKDPSNLSHHNVHAHNIGVRWHTCDFPGCDMRCKKKSNLTMHRAQIHNIGVKWSVCDHPGCDRRFKKTSSLKMHQANKHNIGVTWHTCDYPGCVSKFKDRCNMLRHRTSLHDCALGG